MNRIQFFLQLVSLSWNMQRNELPLKVFITTFAVRIFFQALFFVWVAKIIGGPNWMEFAIYGNVILPALSFLFVDVFNVITDEIDENRIDMLMCSSSSLLSILIGRTQGYVLKAFMVVLYTYATIGLLLLHGYQHWILFVTALPVLVLIILSGYSAAVFISSLNLQEKIAQNLPNFFMLVLMLIGNFTIPIPDLPKFLQIISEIIPMRHGVDAFRMYMTERVPYWTNQDFYIEIVVMLVYISLGYALFFSSVKKARKHPISR